MVSRMDTICRWWRSNDMVVRGGEAVDTVDICGGDDEEHSLPAHMMVSQRTYELPYKLLLGFFFGTAALQCLHVAI